MNNYAYYSTECSECKSAIDLPILFGYGLVAECRYKIGDSIDLKDGQALIKGLVVADGFAGYCPICHEDYVGPQIYYVFIRDNRLESVSPADSRFDIPENSFIVLDSH